MLWLGAACVVVVLLYLLLKRTFSYWQNKGIPSYPSPSWLTGNLRFQDSLPAQLNEYYDYFKSKRLPYGGIYMVQEPMFIPVDLDLLKSILTKDFDHFDGKGIVFNEKQPLQKHLFNIGGENWKRLRAKLTPTFTSGKLKFMFPSMLACSDPLVKTIEKVTDSKGDLDVKDVCSKFTIDVIGTCVFGIECNSFNNPNSEFCRFGKKMFSRTFIRNFLRILTFGFPNLLPNFGFPTIPKEINDFYTNISHETVKYREENNVKRNDFMQLMIELKNKDNENERVSMDEIASQSFVFFLAGFETSSTTMQFVLAELSRNKSIQTKAREEVHKVMSKYNGQITYEGLKEMTYLHQVFEETLRLYPPAKLLNRECTKEYRLPNSNITIDVGTKLLVPVEAIQRDADYFPDPLTFDPERFSEESKRLRHPYAYMPFGEGPRQCIGLRFGILQAKIGLAQLLNRFEFSLHPSVKYPLEFAGGFVSTPLKQRILLKTTLVQ